MYAIRSYYAGERKWRATPGQPSIKESHGFFRTPIEEVKPRHAYRWLYENKGEISVAFLCDLLRLSRPGYYNWLKKKDATDKNAPILSELKEIRKKHKAYGVARLHKALNKERVITSYSIHYTKLYDKYAGKNVTNPIGAILSAGLMLDYIGYLDAAEGIEKAVKQTIISKKVTRDLRGNLSTTEAGDAICSAMK